jgi:hypothetical protein
MKRKKEDRNHDPDNSITINKAGEAYVLKHTTKNKCFIRCLYYPGKGKPALRIESEYGH